MSGDLLAEEREGVLWLTINRESRRNAVTNEVLQGLSDAFDKVAGDRRVRAIVLTGAGDKAFCAGADLQTGNMFAPDFSEPYGKGALVFRKARHCTVPLIARVNGACIAGGVGFMGMCDLAVAAEHAVFGLPEAKVGVFPAQVASVIQHLLPPRVLTKMALTGETISAEQALLYGLVNAVSANVDDALAQLLESLRAVSPTATRRGLYTLKAIRGMSFEESIAFTESQIALFALTEDAAEGQAAFREKRKPDWKGK